LGGHGRGGAGLQEEGFQFAGIAKTRPFEAMAPGDGVPQGQGLMKTSLLLQARPARMCRGMIFSLKAVRAQPMSSG